MSDFSHASSQLEIGSYSVAWADCGGSASVRAATIEMSVNVKSVRCARCVEGEMIVADSRANSERNEIICVFT